MSEIASKALTGSQSRLVEGGSFPLDGTSFCMGRLMVCRLSLVECILTPEQRRVREDKRSLTKQHAAQA